jgi:UDP-glucose 6-dehydrogenase
MILGIIGCGTVGGTLKKWLKEHTTHELRIYDPYKGFKDSLIGCEAIFISVPVPANEQGQDQSILKQSVHYAKQFTDSVFIRSTVLPGTNDQLGTISMPEFLTHWKADKDMAKFSIISGPCDKNLLERIFPNKKIVITSNLAAELGKYVHNCHGAHKINFFNVVNQVCQKLGVSYKETMSVAQMTGYIDPLYTQIAPDGLLGYGGACFPENMKSMTGYLNELFLTDEAALFQMVQDINEQYRSSSEVQYGVEA